MLILIIIFMNITNNEKILTVDLDKEQRELHIKQNNYILDHNLELLDATKQQTILLGNTISFATTNIRGIGFKDNLKSKQIYDTFKYYKIDFVGLTETLHNNKVSFRHKNDEFYELYWTNATEKCTGVGLLVNKSWAKYIQQINNKQDRYLTVDLFFSSKIKLRIIVLYASSNIQQLDEIKDFNKDILNILDNSKKEKFSVLIMGDFNADPDKLNDLLLDNKIPSIKYQLINTLKHRNFYESFRQCHTDDQRNFTWSNSLYKSRIDLIYYDNNFFT